MWGYLLHSSKFRWEIREAISHPQIWHSRHDTHGHAASASLWVSRALLVPRPGCLFTQLYTTARWRSEAQISRGNANVVLLEEFWKPSQWWHVRLELEGRSGRWFGRPSVDAFGMWLSLWKEFAPTQLNAEARFWLNSPTSTVMQSPAAAHSAETLSTGTCEQSAGKSPARSSWRVPGGVDLRPEGSVWTSGWICSRLLVWKRYFRLEARPSCEFLQFNHAWKGRPPSMRGSVWGTWRVCVYVKPFLPRAEPPWGVRGTPPWCESLKVLSPLRVKHSEIQNRCLCKNHFQMCVLFCFFTVVRLLGQPPEAELTAACDAETCVFSPTTVEAAPEQTECGDVQADPGPSPPQNRLPFVCSRTELQTGTGP